MFYDPFRTFFKGRGGSKALKQFATGTQNLIMITVQSIWQTVNKILGTIMRIIASITLHTQYVNRRQNLLNRHIKNIKDGKLK
jgi:hypothetical protein